MLVLWVCHNQKCRNCPWKRDLNTGFSLAMKTMSWKGSLLATFFSSPVNLLFIHARRIIFNKQAVKSLDAPSVCVLGIALELGRGGSDTVHRDSPCWVSAHRRASLPSSGRKGIAFPFADCSGKYFHSASLNSDTLVRHTEDSSAFGSWWAISISPVKTVSPLAVVRSRTWSEKGI